MLPAVLWLLSPSTWEVRTQRDTVSGGSAGLKSDMETQTCSTLQKPVDVAKANTKSGAEVTGQAACGVCEVGCDDVQISPAINSRDMVLLESCSSAN